jgi:hypothetical protein
LKKSRKKCYIFLEVRWILDGGGGKRYEKVSFHKKFILFQTPAPKKSNYLSAVAKKFVVGSYQSGYGLGTYGIDFSTRTVWAVINHAGNFAVKASANEDQNGDSVVNEADVKIIVSHLNQPASVYPSADLDNDGTITILDVRYEMLLKTLKWGDRDDQDFDDLKYPNDKCPNALDLRY